MCARTRADIYVRSADGLGEPARNMKQGVDDNVAVAPTRLDDIDDLVVLLQS